MDSGYERWRSQLMSHSHVLPWVMFACVSFLARIFFLTLGSVGFVHVRTLVMEQLHVLAWKHGWIAARSVFGTCGLHVVVCHCVAGRIVGLGNEL